MTGLHRAQPRKWSQRETGKGTQSGVAGTAEEHVIEIFWKLRNVVQVKHCGDKIKNKERGRDRQRKTKEKEGWG